jgi:hypothetical protein
MLKDGDNEMNMKIRTLVCCVLVIIAAVLPTAGATKTKTQPLDEQSDNLLSPYETGNTASRDGWMLQWSYAYGGNGHAQFAQPVGDIDDDGINEIILGGYENFGICRILYYNTTQQTYVQKYSWSVAGGSPSGACVVDLDEDGKLEFCVSWTYSSADGVYAYKWDGATPTQLDWYHGIGVDFIYDIYTCDYDDDGHAEVLIANDPAAGGKHVTALGWNIDTNTFYYEASWTCPGGAGMACPMVWSGDVDMDEKTEVIADVSDLNYDTAGTWALNWNETTEQWVGVPVYTNYPSGVTVFGDGVGDVDGDGTPEIGVGCYGGTPGGWLFEWDGAGYTQVWHGEYPGQDPVIESVAIGDADNDGSIEFCFGTGNVHIIAWNGTSYYEKATLTGPTNMLAGLIIGDCDSDGENEVKGCEILGGTGSEFIWKCVDTTPPVTTCLLDGEMNGDIYCSNVTVTLTVTDNLSGVDSTMYSLDSGAWTTYTAPFVVSTNGDHTVLFYSVDNVGNIETEKNSTFTIQKETSSLTITIKGGLGVSATITNTGAIDLANVNWTITLDGKLIFLGKTNSGSIPTIAVGGSVTVGDFVFGFGKTGIAVDAGATSANATGTVVLFFVLGVK